MESEHDSEVEQLVARARGGNHEAEERLWSLVYDELRDLAHKKRLPMHDLGALQTTALVHEAYVKLAGDARWDFESLHSFYAAAARAMRNVLVDEIRRKQRLKREGAASRVPFDDGLAAVDARGSECLALDAALQKLELHDANLANLVNLRYFAGLSVDEVCKLTGMSPATYQRHWSYARTWLLREVTTLRDL